MNRWGSTGKKMRDMLAYVIEDLLELIQFNGVQVLIIGALIIVGYLLIRVFYKKVKGGSLFCKYIFVCYLVYVSYLVFFSREPGSREEVNLAFFGTYSHSPRAQAYMFENILLFIPFGFLLPALSKHFNHVLVALGLGVFFSVIIETLQFITKRGYFQLDDIWLNALGSVLGFCGAFFVSSILHLNLQQKNMPLQ